MSEALGLWGVFVSALLSATLLPGNSELALVMYLRHFPTHWGVVVFVATLGNTLGAIITYYMASFLPKPDDKRILQRIEQVGLPLLIFSGLPLVGDALCAAAGWLRLPIGAVICWLWMGKGIRYLGIVFLNQLF